MATKIKQVIIFALLIFTLSSCATILGGKITECQTRKPAQGSPARKIRVAALVADIILFWPGAIIDIATGAIYKPCSGSNPGSKTSPAKSGGGFKNE